MRMLSEGHWTHDYPITFEKLKQTGPPVNDEMPKEVYDLMELYPQASQNRPEGLEIILTVRLQRSNLHSRAAVRGSHSGAGE